MSTTSLAAMAAQTEEEDAALEDGGWGRDGPLMQQRKAVKRKQKGRKVDSGKKTADWLKTSQSGPSGSQGEVSNSWRARRKLRSKLTRQPPSIAAVQAQPPSSTSIGAEVEDKTTFQAVPKKEPSLALSDKSEPAPSAATSSTVSNVGSGSQVAPIGDVHVSSLDTSFRLLRLLT